MITKYSTIILSIDEIKQVLLEYLQGKNISIPEDATIDVKENNTGTYVLVSYVEDADKTEDKPQASTNDCSNKALNDYNYFKNFGGFYGGQYYHK